MPPASDDIFLKYINIFAYYRLQNAKIAALNLIFNGLRFFDGARIIKEFDLYRSLPTGPDTPPDLGIVTFFFEESIMDETRIITCFENYMKAMLLVNGFIAHKVGNIPNKLKKVQNERPIKVEEVFSEGSFQSFDSDKPGSWPTSYQTVNFSTLLKPAYQEVIGLPLDILTLITNLNNDRNKLHFISHGLLQIGDSTIEIYSKLISFKEAVIVKQLTDLDNEFKQLRQRPVNS